jgi:hypothetical protein
MIYKPTLADALAILKNNDEFSVFIEFLVDEREAFIGQMRQAEGPNDIMKLAGSISTLDEILQLVRVSSEG